MFSYCKSPLQTELNLHEGITKKDIFGVERKEALQSGSNRLINERSTRDKDTFE